MLFRSWGPSLEKVGFVEGCVPEWCGAGVGLGVGQVWQFYSLSDLLVGDVASRVVHAAGQVLDEADALGDTHLLLLSQLGGQSGLAGRGVVHRDMTLLLEGRDTHRHS